MVRDHVLRGPNFFAEATFAYNYSDPNHPYRPTYFFFFAQLQVRVGDSIVSLHSMFDMMMNPINDTLNPTIPRDQTVFEPRALPLVSLPPDYSSILDLSRVLGPNIRFPPALPGPSATTTSKLLYFTKGVDTTLLQGTTSWHNETTRHFSSSSYPARRTLSLQASQKTSNPWKKHPKRWSGPCHSKLWFRMQSKETDKDVQIFQI